MSIRPLLRCFQGAVLTASVTLLLLVSVNLLSHSSLSRPQDMLSVFTFIQPLWLLFLAIFCCIGLVLLRKKRLAWCLAVLASLNVLWNEDYRLITRPSRQTIDPSLPSLKVAAWNVQYFFHGLEQVTTALLDTDADVILMSEFMLEPDQLKKFEHRAGPYRLFRSSQGDTAILTRLPVQNVREVYLPSRQASLVGPNRIEDQAHNPRRSFLDASLLFQGHTIHFLSLRFIAGRAASESLLDQLPWGLYLWKTQLEEVQFFKDYIKRMSDPYIFGGDLNAPPSSITLRELNELAQDAYFQQHYWGDFTFKTKMFRQQKEKNMPAIRLDYLFASPGFLVRDIEHRNNRFSDHDMVLASFAFPSYHRISTAAVP
jgi:endonuclease/exonuclease/phosphatase (EEP) superfamily protein YafD